MFKFKPLPLLKEPFKKFDEVRTSRVNSGFQGRYSNYFRQINEIISGLMVKNQKES
jgi:hypothetical protein